MARSYTLTRVDSLSAGAPSASTPAEDLHLPAQSRHSLPSSSRVCFALALVLTLAVSCRKPAQPPRVTAPPPARPEIARAELESRIGSQRVELLSHPFFGDLAEPAKALYASKEWRLLWSVRGRATPEAKSLAGFAVAVGDRGLEPSDYDARDWQARFDAAKGASLDTRAELDLAFTVTVMRIVSDLHGGRVKPNDVEFPIGESGEPFDISAFVARLAQSDDAARDLARLEPQYSGYQRLVAALRQYRAMDSDAEGIVISEMKVVEPGTEYADTPKLMMLLRELGDMPAGEIPDETSTLYAGGLVDAVKRFQSRHGIDADGRIGPATFRAINTPLSWRVRQLELTMERWRWVPRRFERSPVIVNIPEYSLRAYDGAGHPSVDMRVVVGSALRSPTPVLSGAIERVVFQPYWNVPYSVLKDEVLAELDAAYLEKHDMEIVDLSGRDRQLGEEALAGLRGGKLRLRQRPGLKNSLGPVKFDFANEHSIYLHGTPAQALFARSRRDFSHGCIRVEDPELLAAWLLRDEPEWTREAIHAAMTGGATRTVKLKNPTPVLILYGTAVVLEDGEVRFFDDIYGIDKVLDKALKKPRWALAQQPRPFTTIASAK